MNDCVVLGELHCNERLLSPILIHRKTTSQDRLTDIVIIGAGMAGISAALAFADCGYPVHLIERTVSIGGAYVAICEIFPGSRISQ